MRTRTHHVLIGTFVITGVLILCFGVMALGASHFLRRTITVETYIEESVHGLEVGSPVKFRGVKIGEVSEIGFVNRVYDTRLAYVLVRCAARPEAFRDPNDSQRLHEQLVDMIQRGLRVRLATTLGDTFLLVSHELPSIYAIVDRCVLLDAEVKGVLATGNPKELRDGSDDDRVRRFFKKLSDEEAQPAQEAGAR